MDKHPITFISIWDGGYEISTSASLDLDTGIISEIKAVNVGDDDVETLDGELVELDELRAAVVSNDSTDYAFEDPADLVAFAARINLPTPGSK